MDEEDAAGFPARRLRFRSVLAVHRGRQHQDQRQTDPGRRRGRPGRNAAGLHGLEDGHPGPDLQPIDGFTPDQRFFIGMAQWACGYERPESKRVHAITDPHSPDEYRINGVVSNMPEFGAAFPASRASRWSAFQPAGWPR